MRALLVFLLACRTVEPHVPSDGSTADTPFDSGDKSAACASTFGNGLTNAFGRLDGTILAVLEPGNDQCAMGNRTHVVLEVTTNGAAYLMVINVVSTSPDPHVWLGETTAPLAAGPWAEGWHPGVQLDYVATLGVSRSSFTQATLPDAVARLEDALVIGAHVSVFATTYDASGAHLIHRNVTNGDGAIVIDPESSAPRYLLSAFPEQQF